MLRVGGPTPKGRPPAARRGTGRGVGTRLVRIGLGEAASWVCVPARTLATCRGVPNSGGSRRTMPSSATGDRFATNKEQAMSSRWSERLGQWVVATPRRACVASLCFVAISAVAAWTPETFRDNPRYLGSVGTRLFGVFGIVFFGACSVVWARRAAEVESEPRDITTQSR